MHALRDGAPVAGAPDLPRPGPSAGPGSASASSASPSRGRRLVAAAAVIGRQFDFPLVQRAADLSEREAAEGVGGSWSAHRVLRGSGEGLEFSHDRIREVAAEDLAPPLRVALHRRVAESLENVYRHGPAGARAGARPRTTGMGEVWDKAVAHLHAAGRQAAARSAHHGGACALPRGGPDALRQPSGEPRGRWTMTSTSASTCGRACTRWVVSLNLRDHLHEAERLAETLEDRRRLGQVSAYVSNHAWITGDLPRALLSGRRALALAEGLADRRLIVEANLRLGQVHWSLGQYRDAGRVPRRRRTEPDGAGRPRGSSGAAGRARPRRARPLLDRPAPGGAWPIRGGARRGRACAARSRPGSIARSRWPGPWPASASCTLYQGRLDERGPDGHPGARGLSAGAKYRSTAHGSRRRLATPTRFRGGSSEGLTLLKEAVGEAEKSGHRRLTGLDGSPGSAKRCSWPTGRTTRRGVPIGRSSRPASHGERGHEAWALRAQAEVAAARKPSARDAARDRYQEALMLAEALEMRPLEARCHLGLAALHRAAGRHEQARAALDRAVEPLQSMGMAFWLTRARTPGRRRKACARPRLAPVTAPLQGALLAKRLLVVACSDRTPAVRALDPSRTPRSSCSGAQALGLEDLIQPKPARPPRA